MIMPFHTFFQKTSERFSLRRILFFWYRHHKALFFCFFCGVVLIGVWDWYYSFYQYRFSDEEKKQYIEQHFKETAFKETEFRQAVDMLARRTRLSETPEVKHDIFQGTGIQSKEKK